MTEHKAAMQRKIIFRTESGSFLYGTNTPESDKDYLSVFMPTDYDLLSLQHCDMIDGSTKSSSEDRRNTKDDIDDVSYSLPRYVHLVLQGNPNLTEVLFAPHPLIEDESFHIFRTHYSKLISNAVYNSFSGFAMGQRKKLQFKAEHFHQLEETLPWVEARIFGKPKYECVATDEDAVWLNEHCQHYKGEKGAVSHFHMGLPLDVIYEKLKKEYDEFGWRVKTKSFATLGYDIKFGAHAIRLYAEGIDILTTGRLHYPLSGKAFEDIMRIRRGEVGIDEFYAMADQYEAASTEAREKSVLKDKPDFAWANEAVFQVLKLSLKEDWKNEDCTGREEK
jgi:hypothetical protein